MRFKLVVVGDPMAGKTSMLRTLRARHEVLTLPEERTRLVDTSLLNFVDHEPAYCVDVVDFGGQDEYRVAQRLFLTDHHSGNSRTVYCLVVAMDKDPSSESIASWLQCIHHTSSSPVPILVVASKVNLCENQDVLGKRLQLLTSILKDHVIEEEVNLFDFMLL